MNIGTLYAIIEGDATRLLPSIQKEIEKAGDAAGKTMGQRMVTQLKSNAGLAVRALGGALATLGTGQLLQLDKAMAEFRRETGATAAEAKEAGKAINDLSGKNLQGIEEIGRAMSKVRTDLGVTDPLKLKAITQDVLTFAHVTGVDAADAVKAADDALDAWGLTVDDLSGLMDKLVVSQQKFGGSVDARLSALTALAPAMKALNFSMDDSIGLLNLFETKGLDAAATQRAFNTAVKNLPPGTNLKDILDGISRIEDPAKRAAEAIRIFGSRGGVALANALGPGIGAITDYNISQEESVGATKKADEASRTFVDHIKLAVKGLTTSLGELGLTDLGPLILGLTTLGSLGGGKLVKLLLVPFKGLGKLLTPLIMDAFLSSIVPAAAAAGAVGDASSTAIAEGLQTPSALDKYGKAGRLAGSAFAKAAAFAAAAAPILLLVEFILDRPGLEETEAGLQEFRDRLEAKGLLQGVEDSVKESQMQIAAHLADLGTDFDDLGHVVEDTDTKFAAHLADMGDDAKDLRKHLRTETRSIAALFGDLVDSMADDAQTAIDDFFDPMQTHADILADRQKLHAAEEARRNAKTAAETRAASTDIIDALDDQAGHLVDLGKQHKLTAKDVDKYRDDVVAAYKALGKKVPPELQKILDDLDTLANYESHGIKVDVKATVERQVVLDKRAGGGPGEAGVPYLVNEDTPRSEVYVPGKPGQFVTHEDAMRAIASSPMARRDAEVGAAFSAHAAQATPAPFGMDMPVMAVAGSSGGDTFHDTTNITVYGEGHQTATDINWEQRRLAVKKSMAPRIAQRPKTRG